MKKAYWIAVYHEIRDTEKLAAYAGLAAPAITAGGGVFRARGMPSVIFEGGKETRTVIVEFPSIDVADSTYHSAAYQTALVALGDAVDRDIRIIEAA